MQQLSATTGFTFEPAPPGVKPDILFKNTDLTRETAFAYLGHTVDRTMTNAVILFDERQLKPENDEIFAQVLFHEISHCLGFKHPKSPYPDNGIDRPYTERVTNAYRVDQTLMTDDAGSFTGLYNAAADGLANWVSLAPEDVRVFQAVNAFSVAQGNNSYDLANLLTRRFDGPAAYTIVDNGGNDVLDGRKLRTDMNVISIDPAQPSMIGRNPVFLVPDLPNQTRNLIEDVQGSPRQDKIIGNNGANVLNGGLGADEILGGGGPDILYGGGGGRDRLTGGEGKDAFVVRANDQLEITDFNPAQGDLLKFEIKTKIEITPDASVKGYVVKAGTAQVTLPNSTGNTAVEAYLKNLKPTAEAPAFDQTVAASIADAVFAFQSAGVAWSPSLAGKTHYAGQSVAYGTDTELEAGVYRSGAMRL